MTSTRISFRVWIDLALLSLMWGGSFLAVRIALDEIGYLTAVAHRVFWGALALWGFALLRGIRVPLSLRTWGAFAVMGLFNNIVPFSLMSWGQLHIESGLTAILNAATAFMAVIVAAIVFRDERLTRARLVGITLGSFGVALAVGLGNLAAFDVRSLAQIAVLGGAFSYAVSVAWARAMFPGIDPVVSALGMLTCSAVIGVPLAWVVEGPIRLDLAPATWGAIGYYALIATACAYLVYYRILRAAGAGNTAIVTLLIPPVAIVLGALVRGEALPPPAIAGFAILALGLVILNGPPALLRGLPSRRRQR